MIGIDIIRKKRNTVENSGSSKGSAGVSISSGGDAQNAVHADNADHANRADEATHAASAKELDGGSSVWNTIRTWISNAKEGLGDLFLRKDQDDETKHKLTMKDAAVKEALTVDGDATISGKVVTDDIHSSDSDGSTSMTGRGWTLRNVRDETGSYSVLAVDNIVVRKKLEAAELEIHRKTYVGAQQIASDWGHKILRVDPVNMDYETGEVSSISGLTLFTLPVTVDGVERPVAFVGRALSDTETRVELLGDGKGVLNRELETTANAFKVYFCESDGTASIEDDLVVGAMGQCQEFNVKARVTHNFTNTYYWGVCVKHGVEDNVMIGGKATKCVYGVFAHTTELITLTSEVSKKTFTCYGMEQAGCTFPVAGDDMVGFGCADPWQDADRCNAIITASKDGEKSAPSVIAYSGIGRKRGGSIEDLSADKACKAYAGIEEQYSVPSAKDDSRLDFRVSKKAGNVFKGDLYFKGSDENGTLQPVRESETTSVWQLVPVTEKAEIDYSINKDAYKSYQDAALKGTAQNGDAAENGSAQDGGNAAVNGSAQNHADAAAKVFVKKGEVLLKYYILCQKGEGAPVKYETMPNDNLRLTVTAYSESGDALYSFSSSDKNSTYDTKLHDKLSFEDDQATNVSRLSVNLLDNNGNIVDRREVRMKLNTNGVFEANKDFLTYIYYGTDGTGGLQKTNQRISTMEGNFSELSSRMSDAEEGIKSNTQKITETADEYKRELETETSDRKGAVEKLKTSIEATAKGIRTTVSSLYTEGNLLTGGDVRGSRAKRYQAYGSPVTTHLKKGITYTVTARMWLEAKDGYPTQPKMDGHYMTMYVFTKDWKTQWAHSYTYTKSGTIVDSFSFTPESDIDVLVGIYEQISDGPDPKEYGGVSVDWVRLDMGDRTGEKQITKWTPSAGDVEALNLIPDPNFEVTSWETTDGASSRGTIGDVSFMSLYTDDYEDYGFRGVRMTRSGYTGKDGNSDGLIYYIPFRGEGDYAVQAFIKDLNGVTLDNAAVIEVHPADVNQRRICYGFSFALFRRTDETGYFRVSSTYHFGKTATNAASGVSQEIRWLEVRVFLARNGDVVVSRLSLAKCGHAVHWNANALGSENGRTLSMESYAYQRAYSMGAGIRHGLQSVGFRMDSASWSVKTWGNQFAWYATEADANKGTNALMYLDNDGSLHVKGYVEATGGTIGRLTMCEGGLYSQGGDTTKVEYSYFTTDSVFLRGYSEFHRTVYSMKIGYHTSHADDPKPLSGVYGWFGLNGVSEMVRYNPNAPGLSYVPIDLEAKGTQEGNIAVSDYLNNCALGVRCGYKGNYGYGIVSIGMLATHRLTVLTGKGSINVTLQTEGYYVATGDGMTITMPDNPQKGATIIIIQQTSGKVYFNGNGYSFCSGGDTRATAFSNVNGQWSLFLFDGDCWQGACLNGGTLW